MKPILLDLNSPKLTEYKNILKNIDWNGGPFLASKIENGLTKNERVLIFLDEKNQLASFASLLEEDFVKDTGKTPFISTVYVDPKFRGHNLSFQMVTLLEQEAKKLGYSTTYIATGHTGLYEHIGYTELFKAKSISGDETRILSKDLN